VFIPDQTSQAALFFAAVLAIFWIRTIKIDTYNLQTSDSKADTGSVLERFSGA
jgi:hypothetical protein